MNESYDKIKSSQLMFLIAGMTAGSIVLLSSVDLVMNTQDAWIVLLLGYLVSIPFIISYYQLAKKFPGKTLVEMNDMIYGNVLGKIISISYVIFFFLLFSFNCRQLVDIYISFIIPEVPPIAFYILIALVCSYAVKKGIAVIAKINMICFVFAIFTVIFTFLLLLGNMNFFNFLPVFEAPANEFAHTVYILAVLPYCEMIFFLMIMPYVESNKKLGRYVLGGVSIALPLLLMVVVRIITILGPSNGIFTENVYRTVRLVNIGEVLTRMELFVALALTAGMITRISVFQFAAAKGISQLLKLKTGTPLLLPLAALAVVSAMIVFDSTIEKINYINYYHVVFATPFLFLVPPLSLLITKIRKLPRTGELQQ